MKKLILVVCTLLVVSLPLAAKGGGGVEYIANTGSDLLPGLAGVLSHDVWLDVPTGSIFGVGGFGYGVLRNGFKIGGYGLGFASTDFTKDIQIIETRLTGVAGGVGGVITGTQAGLGPFEISFNTRLGAGGIGIRTGGYNSSHYSSMLTSGAFIIHTAADAEVGFLFGRNMLLSAYTGVNVFLVFNSFVPVVPMLTPAIGIRITWGSF